MVEQTQHPFDKIFELSEEQFTFYNELNQRVAQATQALEDAKKQMITGYRALKMSLGVPYAINYINIGRDREGKPSIQLRYDPASGDPGLPGIIPDSPRAASVETADTRSITGGAADNAGASGFIDSKTYRLVCPEHGVSEIPIPEDTAQGQGLTFACAQCVKTVNEN